MWYPTVKQIDLQFWKIWHRVAIVIVSRLQNRVVNWIMVNQRNGWVTLLSISIDSVISHYKLYFDMDNIRPLFISAKKCWQPNIDLFCTCGNNPGRQRTTYGPTKTSWTIQGAVTPFDSDRQYSLGTQQSRLILGSQSRHPHRCSIQCHCPDNPRLEPFFAT